MTNEKELLPIYDDAKSFHGKAWVFSGHKTLLLKSYDTYTAGIDLTNSTVKLFNKPNAFSNTSLRHLKEFLKQNGFKAETKSQILKDYILVN